MSTYCVSKKLSPPQVWKVPWNFFHKPSAEHNNSLILCQFLVLYHFWWVSSFLKKDSLIPLLHFGGWWLVVLFCFVFYLGMMLVSVQLRNPNVYYLPVIVPRFFRNLSKFWFLCCMLSTAACWARTLHSFRKILQQVVIHFFPLTMLSNYFSHLFIHAAITSQFQSWCRRHLTGLSEYLVMYFSL